MTSPDSATFAGMFREEIHGAVEYSFGADPTTHGTMIAGSGEPFRHRIRTFASLLPFAGSWIEDTDRFASLLSPPSFLFKVDWRQEQAERLSFYFRFFNGIPWAALENAFENVVPFGWVGPAPQQIGDALAVGNPKIIGLRVDKSGQYQSSLYYDLAPETVDFEKRVVEPLLEMLEWPSVLPAAISADIVALTRRSRHVALGIDSGTAEKAPTLKFSAGDVEWAQVWTVLSRNGVPRERLARLAEVARQLRQARLNYSAMKFGPSGFQGWKLYWAVLGRQPASGTTPRLVVT